MGHDPKTLDELRRNPRQGKLEPGRDEGGFRYCLAGAPVHAGTALELRLSGDRWVRGRFEIVYGVAASGGCRWNETAPVGPLVRFYLRLWSHGENDPDFLGGDSVCMDLPPSAVLRWPEP